MTKYLFPKHYETSIHDAWAFASNGYMAVDGSDMPLPCKISFKEKIHKNSYRYVALQLKRAQHTQLFRQAKNLGSDKNVFRHSSQQMQASYAFVHNIQIKTIEVGLSRIHGGNRTQ